MKRQTQVVFKRPAYTTIPNEILDSWMAGLSGSEFKVLCYVARRTFGFHRDYAKISFAQMCDGLVTAAGVRLDEGTGLARSTALLAVDTLVERGVLVRRQTKAKNGAITANTYTLMVEDANSPTGAVAADELPAFTPMPEIGQGETGAIPEIGQPAIPISGIAYMEKKESREIKPMGGGVTENGKKQPIGVGRCGECNGFGMVDKTNAPAPAPHNGTLAQVRNMRTEQRAEFCTCVVGDGWRRLLADAELPMVRKGQEVRG